MTKLLKISKYKPSIFQGRLDFASAQGGMSLLMEHPLERIVVRTLSIVLIALICGYLYFVSASVLNVIARKEALAQTAKIEGAIGGLESRYFALSHGIQPSAGTSLGLSPVKQTQYVDRLGNVGVATRVARNEI